MENKLSGSMSTSNNLCLRSESLRKILKKLKTNLVSKYSDKTGKIVNIIDFNTFSVIIKMSVRFFKF